MTETLPKCYGLSWDDTQPKCAGGRDATYTDDHGSHIRERCDFFGSCGARVQASRQLIQPQQLVRTPAPAIPPPFVPSPSLAQTQQIQVLMQQMEQMRQTIQQQNTQLHSQQPRYTSGYTPQPVQSQMMATEFSMPRYLTVPEPRGVTSIWSLLGREIVRSIMKSAGHTMANFWDTTPIGRDK